MWLVGGFNAFVTIRTVASVQLNDTTAAMPSELETAMESLITVFHRYASREGRNGTLSRRELRELMENELSNFLKVRRSPARTLPHCSRSCRRGDLTLLALSLKTQSQKDPAAVDKIMKDLDTNCDGQVDFEEFVSLVVGLSIACEQCYKMQMRKMSKK